MHDVTGLLKASAQKTEAYLEKYFEHVEKDLLLLAEAEKYSLFGGGKRIRPFLVFEFCRMFGGEERAAEPFASAVEMVHTYSLIHDDLPCMDDDTYRRGRLTCHKQYDEATAILAGDALLTEAFGIVAGNPYVSPMVAKEAVVVLSEAAGSKGMVGGQILDMYAEKKPSMEIKDVLRLQALKTGALICAAAKLGALAAGKTKETKEYEAAERYAQGIGLAFQIVDDILDVEGDAELLGKATGADAKMNKVTFLNFYSVSEARAYAAKLTEQATEAISSMPQSQTLCCLASHLLKRTY